MLIALVPLLLSGAALAAETSAQVNQEYASVVDRQDLPRVLPIGDSISIGYTLPVRALLRDVANVHRPPENCGSTRLGLESLERWLGETKWDAIHFNFGLHDCLIEDGKHPVPLEEFEHARIRRLKRTMALNAENRRSDGEPGAMPARERCFGGCGVDQPRGPATILQEAL